MSSFCLRFLEIFARLSMYNKSPDPLFISGEARPLVNETPNATLLLLVSVVIPELNVVSTAPLPDVAFERFHHQ